MKLEGKSVFSGIAIGKCKIFGKKDQVVKRSKVTDTDLEIKRQRASWQPFTKRH